jgi:hypothetical protein
MPMGIPAVRRVTLEFQDAILDLVRQTDDEGETHGFELGSVFLDGDDKNGVGLPYDESRKGWDVKISVESGIEFRDASGNRMRQWGNVSSIAGTHTVDGVFVTHGVFRAGSLTPFNAGGGDHPEPAKLTEASGRQVRVRVCYTDDMEEMKAPGRNAHDGTFEIR